MPNYIPTLGLDGFINNPQIVMRKLWLYFLTSEYSQSSIFYGDIKSFKYIMATAKVGTDIEEVMENSLRNLYNKYFNNVSVDVECKLDPNTQTHYLKIALVVNDNGKNYQLANEIEYVKGNIKDFENKLDELYDFYIGQK